MMSGGTPSRQQSMGPKKASAGGRDRGSDQGSERRRGDGRGRTGDRRRDKRDDRRETNQPFMGVVLEGIEGGLAKEPEAGSVYEHHKLRHDWVIWFDTKKVL